VYVARLLPQQEAHVTTIYVTTAVHIHMYMYVWPECVCPFWPFYLKEYFTYENYFHKLYSNAAKSLENSTVNLCMKIVENFVAIKVKFPLQEVYL